MCRKRLNETQYLRTELLQAARRMGEAAGLTTLATLRRMAASTIDPIGAYLVNAFVCGIAETEEMRGRLRELVPEVAEQLIFQLRRGR